METQSLQVQSGISISKYDTRFENVTISRCELRVSLLSFQAVVSVNSFHFLSTSEHVYNDVTYPLSMLDMSMINFDSPTLNCREAFLAAENIPENTIPVENIQEADVLFIQGSEDQLVDSQCAALMAYRLRQHNRNNFALHIYPKTGHLIEPAYLPVCPINYHSVFRFNMEYGGVPEYHARAQEDSWFRIINFFKDRLGAKKPESHL